MTTIEKIIEIKEELEKARKEIPYTSVLNRNKTEEQKENNKKRELLLTAIEHLRDAGIALDSLLSVNLASIE